MGGKLLECRLVGHLEDGNSAIPALIPFGPILELESALLFVRVPFAALPGAVPDALRDELLTATEERLGELLCFTTAADEVEIESVDAVELVDAAPRGSLWF